jgi:uncharacterized protein YqeY
MATTKTRLTEDMKMAQRASNKAALTSIRMALASIKNEEIEARGELAEDREYDILATEIKQAKDSRLEYAKFPDKYADKIAELDARVELLVNYMPAQLTIDELKAIIEETKQAVGATSKAQMGAVMAALMPKVKHRMDGKMVNQTVAQML